MTDAVEGLPEGVKTRAQMTPEDLHKADQQEAEALSQLEYLANLMLALWRQEGNHPGRYMASDEWLWTVMELSESHVKGLLQYACWLLAESMVASPDHVAECTCGACVVMRMVVEDPNDPQ